MIADFNLNHFCKLMIMEAMIFESSSASPINLFIFSFSFAGIVSLIKQSQYFVSLADFSAIV